MRLAATIIIALSSTALAGPLTPPPGPIAPTHKTLTEVEPRIAVNSTNTPGNASASFRITQPGSYYLTGNIAGEANKHGIQISASGVTLDLNGFDIVGLSDATTFDGISATGRNITIRNGSVRSWGDRGIDIVPTVTSVGILIENIRSSNNGGSGIGAGSFGTMVINCTAVENGGTGISASRLIQSCIAVDNGGVGLSMGQGGSILDSTAFSNDGNGINVGFGCTVTNCTSDNNVGNGIEASNGTTISNSSFLANGGSGIFIYNSVTVTNCTAVSNQQYGIDADTACLIENSLANSNTLGGIRCGSRCTVRNNVTGGNTSGAEIGSGIHVTGNSTRVEGNTCNTNDFGIDIDGTGNIIIRNSCTGNTQAFIIAADNIYGPIVDRRTPGSPLVVGFSATGTMGSTDHNANFAH